MTVITKEKLAERTLDQKISACWAICDALPYPQQAQQIRGLIDYLVERVADLEDEQNIHAMQSAQDETYDAIDRFLDCIERPVGTRAFTVPKSAEATRAIIGLYAAIGRNM